MISCLPMINLRTSPEESVSGGGGGGGGGGGCLDCINIKPLRVCTNQCCAHVRYSQSSVMQEKPHKCSRRVSIAATYQKFPYFFQATFYVLQLIQDRCVVTSAGRNAFNSHSNLLN